MYKEDYVLKKIEQWVDKLPYRSAEIRIELDGKTYTLTKDRCNPIGFSTGEK